MTVRVYSGLEERSGCGDVGASGDENVDDLAVFVDRPLHVAPHAGDFDVSLIDEAPPADRMPTRSRRVDEQWRETLNPPKQRHVIDIDAALGEELLEVAIRQTKAEIPARRQHHHLGREPEPHERRQIKRWHGTTAALHRRTLADGVRSVDATHTRLSYTVAIPGACGGRDHL